MSFRNVLSCSILAVFQLALFSVNAADNLSENPSKSVREFINPDGRFDLDSLRKSGYQGVLDLTGLNVQLDPITGEPIVRTASINSLSPVPDDVYWDNSISASDPILNGSVLALTKFRHKLIVGGAFIVNGEIGANRIAAWDGRAWSALGAGMNKPVYALATYKGRLFAAGSFTEAGGETAIRIASWDGRSWSYVGTEETSLSSYPKVYALTVYDNKLIAGGVFSKIGGLLAYDIAAWDGSSWSTLGRGVHTFIYAMTVYDGKLIVGGYFHLAGKVEVHNIAAWDGSTWSTLGTGTNEGVNGTVCALMVYDNKLIVGGRFSSAGDVAANQIASWDGSSWSMLGAGIDGRVIALAEYDNKLIAGGLCYSAGNRPVNYIAAWDGNSWTGMGTGLNREVNAMIVYDRKLTVGGRFTIAGGKEARYLAQWTKGIATGIEDNDFTQLPTEHKLSQNYPNPFNPETLIEFELPQRARVRLSVFNVLGQEVTVLLNDEVSAGSHRVTWDGKNSAGVSLASGIYFYRLVADDFVELKKMILIK